jgi:uncharacterized protein YcnI
MHRSTRGLLVPTLVSSLLLGTAAAVSARPQILEPEVEASGARTAIHLRILGGCQGQAIDRIELMIPEGVVGVAPEAQAGWTIETEEVATEPYELFGETLATRVGTVRWTGSLADGQFLDLGLAAVFRDAGELVFPVLQGCGTAEVEYAEPVPEGTEPNEVELRAPTLEVVERVAPVDLPALQATVDDLTATVATLRDDLDGILTRAGDVAVPKLRDEVDEIRRAVDRLRERLDELAPEESPAP